MDGRLVTSDPNTGRRRTARHLAGNGLGFSPDGRHLAVGGGPGSGGDVRFYDSAALGEGRVLRSKVDCLRICESGPICVVYPEGTWYFGVTVEVMDRIIDRRAATKSASVRACCSRSRFTARPRASMSA